MKFASKPGKVELCPTCEHRLPDPPGTHEPECTAPHETYDGWCIECRLELYRRSTGAQQ